MRRWDSVPSLLDGADELLGSVVDQMGHVRYLWAGPGSVDRARFWEELRKLRDLSAQLAADVELLAWKEVDIAQGGAAEAPRLEGGGR